MIHFLSPVDELKSIKQFNLWASQDVRKTIFLHFFCPSLWQLEQFNHDDISCVCSKSVLFCGSFENCESSNKISDYMNIGSGSILSILIC